MQQLLKKKWAVVRAKAKVMAFRTASMACNPTIEQEVAAALLLSTQLHGDL